MLAREFPGVRTIANKQNFMGSYAVNQGIAAAGGEFVYVTADDNVLDPECIGALADAMARRPDAGLIAPVMYYYDAPERIWFAGCDINMLTGLTRFATELPSGGNRRDDLRAELLHDSPERPLVDRGTRLRHVSVPSRGGRFFVSRGEDRVQVLRRAQRARVP